MFLIFHLLGVALGVGGAYTSDVIILTALRDHRLSKNEYVILHRAGYVVIFGLFLLIASGVGLFLSDPQGYLASTKFLTKMIIVGIVTVNGCLLHLYSLPLLKRHLNKHLLKEKTFQKDIPYIILLASISVTSWTSALILGALPRIPISIESAILIYLGTILAGFIIGNVTYAWRKRMHGG
ncbi:MAG: hypothetical protein O3B64_01035 [bacterium]|nr:hypothetical protein [bacterium]